MSNSPANSGAEDSHDQWEQEFDHAASHHLPAASVGKHSLTVSHPVDDATLRRSLPVAQP